MLSYSELIKLPTFESRFNYLKLSASVGIETFGFNRYLNQAFYNSPEWRDFRNQIILRDNGCDLAAPGFFIQDRILIHHLNPLTEYDIINRSSNLFDPENVICVSRQTHNAIHYGTTEVLPTYTLTERRPGDTKLW